MEYAELSKQYRDAALYFDNFIKTTVAAELQRKHGKIVDSAKWRDRLIYGLLEQAQTDYAELKRVFDSDGPLSTVAFHARNLLELMIWAVHCVIDEKHVLTLYNDTAKDARELIDSYGKFPAEEDENRQTSIDDAKARLVDAAKRHGIDSVEGKYQRVSQVAELYPDLDDQYKFSYKFLSKCAHPTALTIFGLPDEAVDHFKSSFFDLGCAWYAATVRPLILDYDLSVNDPLQQGNIGDIRVSAPKNS